MSRIENFKAEVLEDIREGRTTYLNMTNKDYAAFMTSQVRASVSHPIQGIIFETWSSTQEVVS